MRKTETLTTTDGNTIHAYHYKRGHKKVIVIAHGFYSNKENPFLKKLAESLLETYDVFIFDFRGHGKSSGVYTWVAKEKNDLTVVLGYLEDKYA
jgi:pimeloyl-ACP methyl ester carboxylesterase